MVDEVTNPDLAAIILTDLQTCMYVVWHYHGELRHIYDSPILSVLMNNKRKLFALF